MKNEVKLVKNTLILSLGTLFPKMVSIITIPILTAGLSRTEYGTYDLITTLVTLLLPVLTLQIQSAAFRFLIEYRGDEYKSAEIITNIFVVTLPVSFVALSILYFVLKLSPLIKILICTYYFFDIFFLALQQIARGMGKNIYYSVSAIIVSLVNLLTIVVFIGGLHSGLIGVLLSLTISYGIALMYICIKIFSFISLKWKFISKGCIKEMLAYSWPMVPNNLSSWVLSLSDRIVITAFVGIEANAIYAVANKLPNLFYTVQSTFTLAWQENASETVKEDNFATYYSNMFDMIFRFVCGLMAGIIGFTPILFVILIRGDYDAAYVQIPILFMGCLFSSLSSFLGGIYIALKKTKSIGITTICAAIVNVYIDLIAVRYIGITAGSISTLISCMLLAIYRMYGVKKYMDIKYNYKVIISSMLILVLMCLLCVRRDIICSIINFVGCFIVAFVLNRKLLRSIVQYRKTKIQAK